MEAQYQSKDIGSITPLQSRKLKYKSLAENYHFTPIAIETFGAWRTESHKIIKEIGKKVMETTGAFSVGTSHLLYTFVKF